MLNYQELEKIIEEAYTSNVSIEDAEKNAALFLSAQLQISKRLHQVDLDSRMRKTGLKTIKAGVYLEEVKKSDKKPSDTMLEQIINSSQLVKVSQDQFDESEAELAELQRIFGVMKEAHVYFRTMSKREV